MFYAIARVEGGRWDNAPDRTMVPRLAAVSAVDALDQFRRWLFENNPAGEMESISRIVDGRLFIRDNLYYAGTLEHYPSCGSSGVGECDCSTFVRETA